MPRIFSLAVAMAAGVGCASADSLYVLGPVVAALMWAALLVLLVMLARAVGPDAPVFRLALCGVALCAGGLVRVYELAHQTRVIDSRSGAADDRIVDTIEGIVHGPVERVAYHTGARVRFVVHLDPPATARVEVRADASAAPWPGDRVLATGLLRTPRGYRVPGRIPVERILWQRGADLAMSARRVEVLESDARPTVWRWASQAHVALSETIRERGGSAAGNAVVRAMITGDRSGLDRELSERYRDAGVAHVLAVSGLHLAVVALTLFAGMRRIWAAVPDLAMRVRPDLVAALVALPAAASYTLITGARPSTLRAFVVIAAVLVGAALGRRARLLDALGFAAIVLLAHRPSHLFDPGFQLSFAAATTLILSARPGAGLRGLVRTSVWVTLATAPLTALAFGTIAYTSVLTNLLAVPLTELVIVPLGLVGALVHSLWPALGGAILDLVIACAAALDLALAYVAERAPALHVFPPNAWELLAALCIWAGAVAIARRAWVPAVRNGLMALGIASLLAVRLYTVYAIPELRGQVRITFLDVGQGDAAVIELPGDRVWVIDSGGLPFVGSWIEDERTQRHLAESPGRLSVLRFLAERRIRRIDLLVISHPHPDHFEGAHALAREIPIRVLWVARDHGTTAPSYRALLETLERAGTRIEHPRLGHALRADQISLIPLAPRYLDQVATHDPVMEHNDNSLVVRMHAFGRTVLFTGDIEHEGEALLVRSHAPALRADVVKVPHHGSRTSSTPDFVAATSPALAVISCGLGNRFGLPATGVVERWQEAGARVLRTDVSGAITVTIAPDGALTHQTFDPVE